MSILFSETLKKNRTERGLSQQELADRVGVHVNTVVNWEEHPENMSIKRAFEVVDALGVTIDDIIFLRQ
jgi:DNA-binding XRE family transcriptional regulator